MAGSDALRILFIQTEPEHGRLAEEYIRVMFDGRVEFQIVTLPKDMDQYSLSDWDAVLIDVGGTEENRHDLMNEVRARLGNVPTVDLAEASLRVDSARNNGETPRSLTRLRIHPFLILHCLGYLLQNRQLEGEIRRLRMQLTEAGRFDPVSGLWARSYTRDRVREMFSDWERYRRPICMCLIDIPDIRKITEEMDEYHGEKIAGQLGRLIQHLKRDTDSAGRIGPTEYCLLFPNTPLNQAMIGIERIARSLKDRVYALSASKNLLINGSIAAVQVNDEHTDFEDLFIKAHRTLERAKANGAWHIEIDWTGNGRRLKAE